MTGVAVVTGAARGIGAATVRALASAGWTVVATDRAADDPRLPYALGSARDLDALAGDCTAGAVSTAVADAADHTALAEVIAEAERAFGGVDAIVAAAGVIAGGVPLWEMPIAEQEAVIEVNLGGALAAARAGIPALLRRPAPRRGRVVMVASAGAVRGLPMLAAYCAAKAGVLGLVRALGAELGGSGITANAVSPGSTRTAMLEESARLYGLASMDAFASQQPLQRLLEPEEVAALIAWLLGPGGDALTGANLPVDGGLSL
jgi:SDR family mycofactocin-dependent oxidoreductase